MSRTTAAWTILSIVFWILFVCVVHEINWLLKYVLSCNDKYNQDRRILFFTYSFEENTWYMRFCSRTKCWQVTLRLIATISSHFFKKSSDSHFPICHLLNTEWPHFSAQIVLIFILMLQVVMLSFFNFSFGYNIF